MRRLIIVRHAKAERSQPGGSDLFRRLEPRGRNDAAAMGADLAKHNLVPDLAAVSTAARTRETWALAGAAFTPAVPVAFESRIYDAEADDILAVIAETDSKIETLAVVGHNPGVHELAALLAGSGDANAQDRLALGFPTAGVAVIAFDSRDWHLRPHSGRIERFISPKTVSGATD